MDGIELRCIQVSYPERLNNVLIVFLEKRRRLCSVPEFKVSHREHAPCHCGSFFVRNLQRKKPFMHLNFFQKKSIPIPFPFEFQFQIISLHLNHFNFQFSIFNFRFHHFDSVRKIWCHWPVNTHPNQSPSFAASFPSPVDSPARSRRPVWFLRHPRCSWDSRHLKKQKEVRNNQLKQKSSLQFH